MQQIFIIGILMALFSSVYFFIKRDGAPATRVVAVHMLLLALPMVIKGDMLEYRSHLIHALMNSICFTYAPLLYLYTSLLVENRRHLTLRDTVHFAAFPLALLLMWAEFAFGCFSIEQIKTIGPRPEWIAFFVAINISYLGYAAAMLRRLRQHRKNIGNYFSYESSTRRGTTSTRERRTSCR